MNIIRKRKVSNKKFTPRHFRRRNVPSIYEILNAARHKRRNKKLLQNNKALASALEEAQCTISMNNRMLQNLAKDSNQVLLAKLKMRSMAIALQKLIADLDDVKRCLDISINIPKLNINENVRLRIPEPVLETIDESDFSREDEEILSQKKRSLIKCDSPENTIFFGNSSVTEIYNVQKYLPNVADRIKDVAAETSTVEAIETTPQLNLIHSSRLSDSEQFRSDSEKVDSLKNSLRSPVNISQTAVTSNTPLRKNLFQESDISPPLLHDHKYHQETFVVTKLKVTEDGRLNHISATGKHTFKIAEISRDMQAQNDARGIFAVPALPLNISKPSRKIPPHSEDFCVDDKTVHLSEDMDLTEIIPSATLSVASKSLLNKNRQLPVGNVIHPSICKNKETEKIKVSPPIIKMKEISPIAKLSMKSDSNKEALETGIETKLVDLKSPETIISPINKIDLGFSSDDVFSCKPNEPIQMPPRKSVLPNFVSLRTSCKLSKKKKSIRDVLSSDVGSNNQISIEKPISESREIIGSSIIPKENLDYSTSLSKTATSPVKSAEKVLEKSPEKYFISYCISSDEISTDSDPDFVVDIPVACERERIPGRKSIRPNRRKPFIFTKSKNKKSIGKTKDNSDLLPEIKEKYDFSLSDSEEESSKNKKIVECKKPKKSFKFRKSKEKSTVAVLERDINLKFQDQSRKRRSLKPRVSIVNLNTSPSEKDKEEKFNELTEQSTASQTGGKQIEIRGPRKSIFKRKFVFVSEKQSSPGNLYLQNIPKHEDLQEKKSATTMIAASDKSDEKNFSKKSRVREEDVILKSTESATSPVFKTKKAKGNEGTNLKFNSKMKSNVEIKSHNGKTSTSSKPMCNSKLNEGKNSAETFTPQYSKTDTKVRFEKDLSAGPILKENFEEKKSEQEKDKVVSSNTVSKSVNDDDQLQQVTNSLTVGRSSKCRVSFANLNTSPSKKDKEDEKINEYAEQSTTLQTGDKHIEISGPRKSILKRKSLFVSEKQGSPSKLYLQNITEPEDLQDKISAVKVIATSDKSGKKIPSKDSKVQEEEINKKLKLICENSTDDKQNKASQSLNKLLVKSFKQEIKLKSTESAPSQYFKTKKAISFEKESSAGTKLKENLEVENKSEQDKTEVESSSTVSKSVNVDDQLNHISNSLIVKLKNDTEVKTDLVLNTEKKRKNNRKPKQNAEICLLNELQPNKLSEENKSPKKSIRGTSPPSCKTRKTISNINNELKENLVIPDLESGRRSRRTRANVNFKEPSLHKKMRRVK